MKTLLLDSVIDGLARIDKDYNKRVKWLLGTVRRRVPSLIAKAVTARYYAKAAQVKKKLNFVASENGISWVVKGPRKHLALWQEQKYTPDSPYALWGGKDGAQRMPIFVQGLKTKGKQRWAEKKEKPIFLIYKTWQEKSDDGGSGASHVVPLLMQRHGKKIRAISTTSYPQMITQSESVWRPRMEEAIQAEVRRLFR